MLGNTCAILGNEASQVQPTTPDFLQVVQKKASLCPPQLGIPG